MPLQNITSKKDFFFSASNFEIQASGHEDEEEQSGTAVVSEVRTVPKEPKMYKVLLHNDDYTPMEFVVFILEHFFNKPKATAEKIMMDVHRSGVGVCGVYPYEVAETKTKAVQDAAKENQYPLLCSCQEE